MRITALPNALPSFQRALDEFQKSLSRKDIEDFKAAYAAAVRRAVQIGFDAIEIHNAHGYLLHEFLSPVSNKRTDKYGGNFETRTRLTLEVVGCRGASRTAQGTD